MRKTLWALLLSFGLAAVAQTPQPTPKLGWKKTRSETFSLKASKTRYYRIGQTGRWRFDFKAGAAISTGVLTPEQVAELGNKKLALAAFKNFACVRTSVLETSVECPVREPKSMLAIRDERGPSATSDGAAKPNIVTATFYVWACLENCPTMGQ